MRNLEEVDGIASGEPHLAVVRAPADRNPQWTSGASWRPTALALAAALVASVAWLSTSRPPASSLAALPAAQRAAVAERALANLRDVCTARDHPRDFCEGQAQLLLDLPECGAECRTLVRQTLSADMAVR